MSLPTKKTEIYSNWVMQAPDGTFMCRVAAKRAKWYLDRNLATLNGEKAIKLNFNPAGLGHAGIHFYTSHKVNQCVVCGAKDDLTKHHIVPHTYRRYFPENYKAHSSHDVLIVCEDCHVYYETNFSINLHKKLAKEMKMPMNMGFEQKVSDNIDIKVLKLINVLIKEKKVPEERKKEIIIKIEDLLGCKIEIDNLKSIAEKIKENREKNKYKPHDTFWFKVVEKVIKEKKLHDFIVRWRLDFIINMKPKFMPPGWDVNYQEKK